MPRTLEEIVNMGVPGVKLDQVMNRMPKKEEAEAWRLMGVHDDGGRGGGSGGGSKSDRIKKNRERARAAQYRSKLSEMQKLSNEIIQNVKYAPIGTTRPDGWGPIDALPKEVVSALPKSMTETSEDLRVPTSEDTLEYYNYYRKMKALGASGKPHPGESVFPTFVDLTSLSPKARQLYEYWRKQNMPESVDKR